MNFIEDLSTSVKQAKRCITNVKETMEIRENLEEQKAKQTMFSDDLTGSIRATRATILKAKDILQE